MEHDGQESSTDNAGEYIDPKNYGVNIFDEEAHDTGTDSDVYLGNEVAIHVYFKNKVDLPTLKAYQKLTRFAGQYFNCKEYNGIIIALNPIIKVGLVPDGYQEMTGRPISISPRIFSPNLLDYLAEIGQKNTFWNGYLANLSQRMNGVLGTRAIFLEKMNASYVPETNTLTITDLCSQVSRLSPGDF